MDKLRLIFLLITIALLINSCGNNNKFDIDVSDIDIEMKYHRFDQDLFAINVDSIYNEIPDIAAKYPDFFDLFTKQIINIGGMESKLFPEYLEQFLTDLINKEVYEYTQTKFNDFGKYEEEINEAFRHYKYYFPDKNIPEVYLYVSRFNQSVVTAENILGIGIDKYLGSSCNYYQALGLPQYMRYKMRPDMIVIDCMRGWAQSEFEFDEIEGDMLAHMLYKAKLQYFIDAMLPDKADTLKWGFTSNQMIWCQNNEKEIWMYLVDNKLLFSTDYKQVKRFTEDGPFTTNFSDESPARATVWLGMQIIESYLKHNPDITFQDLMNETDYLKILNNSKYEP